MIRFGFCSCVVLGALFIGCGGSTNPASGGAQGTGGVTSVGGTRAAGGASSTISSSATTTAAGTTVTGGSVSVGGATANPITTTGGTDGVGGATSTGGTGATETSGGTLNATAPTGGAGGTGGVLVTGGTSASLGGNTATAGTSTLGGSGVCSRDCKWEDASVPTPTCPASGGVCAVTCGDGLVSGSEQCDDGNTKDGDGCSSLCKVETGFACGQASLGDTLVMPMVVRDFDAGGDFEPGAGFATALNYANQALVQDRLGASGKPALASTKGTYNGTAGQPSGITNTASFTQWFDDAATGTNVHHATFNTSINLYAIPGSDPVTYVNRFGNNGDGLDNTQYVRTHTAPCGTVNQTNHDVNGNPIPCTACYYNANCSTAEPNCALPCTQNDSTPCQTDPKYTGQCTVTGTAWTGTFLDAAFDGNPLFFPADAAPTPWSPNTTAMITGNYNPSWPTDPSGKSHNFSFTTEVRFWFKYDASKTYNLTFVSEDDMWVFINQTLAVDLGGIHTPVQGQITLDAVGTTTSVTALNFTPPPSPVVSHPALDLTDGGTFEIAVFSAQRQTKGSSYQLMLAGFNTSRSVCEPICGEADPGVCASHCDPSTADCYNQCTTSCTRGPYCGDGIVQPEHEQCDPGAATRSPT